jgi:hypothetical protein
MTTSTHMSPIRSKRLARCDLRPPFSVQFTVSPVPAIQAGVGFAELRARAPRRRSVGHGRRTVGVAVGPHRPPASLFPPTNAPPAAGPTMHQLWPMHLKRKRVLSPSTQ